MAMNNGAMEDSADGVMRSVEVTIPPTVHIAAVVLSFVMGGIAYKDLDLVGPVAGCAATIAGLYSVYYARRSIETQRLREKRQKTIEFSATFSRAPVSDARGFMAATYESIVGDAVGPNDEAKSVDAQTIFSKTIDAAFDRRGSGDVSSTDKELMRSTLIILDYFEDLTVGLSYGVFDEQVARNLLRGPLLRFWGDCSRFVEKYRIKQKHTSAYGEMESWAKRWKAVS